MPTDAMSDTFRRHRRNLMATSGVWLFITSFGVSGVKLNIVEFKVDETTSTAISTVFIVLIVYHLAAFMFHLHTDWRGWLLAEVTYPLESGSSDRQAAERERRVALRSIQIRVVIWDLGLALIVAATALAAPLFVAA